MPVNEIGTSVNKERDHCVNSRFVEDRVPIIDGVVHDNG